MTSCRRGGIVLDDEPGNPDVQKVSRLQLSFKHGSAIDKRTVFGAEISHQQDAVDTVDLTVLAADPTISDTNVSLRSTTQANRKVGKCDFAARNERIFGDQPSGKAHVRGNLRERQRHGRGMASREARKRRQETELTAVNRTESAPPCQWDYLSRRTDALSTPSRTISADFPCWKFRSSRQAGGRVRYSAPMRRRCRPRSRR